MKKINYKENIELLKCHFNKTDNCTLDDFIPGYYKEQLYLPSNELDIDLAVKNIETKLQRDWLYHTSFMNIVDIVAQLGTCSRRKVGAVLVRSRRILATGFNGTPPGSPHCNDEICPGRNAPSGSDLSLCSAVHAEENCLIYCAKYGVSASGAFLYVSCEPCDDCMKLVETVGITHVIYKQAYPTKMSALRKYFKAKTLSMEDLAAEYSKFCQGRIKF
ncbi:MAG: dCMP deaminase family protein [Cyanobacteriota bacterium]